MPSFLIVDSSVCRGTPSLTAAPVASLRESEGVVGWGNRRGSQYRRIAARRTRTQSWLDPVRRGVG
jgi:hypothetical protein